MVRTYRGKSLNLEGQTNGNAGYLRTDESGLARPGLAGPCAAMSETQQSVTQWADETFGPCTVTRATERAVEEMEEFKEVDKQWTSATYLADLQAECADVVITLYRVASTMGFDLHAEIDRKMAVNRQRKWKVNQDGTGYHIRDEVAK